MHVTLSLFLLIAALILFIVDTWQTRSLVSAGLACAAAAFLLAGVTL